MAVGTVLRDAARRAVLRTGGDGACNRATGSALPDAEVDGQQSGSGSEEDPKEEDGETHPDGAPWRARRQIQPGRRR